MFIMKCLPPFLIIKTFYLPLITYAYSEIMLYDIFLMTSNLYRWRNRHA